MNGLEYLGQKTVAKTASIPKSVAGEGTVIAYCDAPMVCIKQEYGTYVWWRADLCEFSGADEVEKEIAGMSQEEIVQAIEESAGMWKDHEDMEGRFE